MLAFYNENMIETGYIRDKISCIEKDLEQIFFSSRQLKYTYIDLTLSLGYSEREIEQFKETFWINLVNFMTLFKIAEISLIKPGFLKKLNNYALWQAFWTTNYIYISECRVN